MTWKSWSDNPYIVGIGAISALIGAVSALVGIATFVLDRTEKSTITPNSSSVAATANPPPASTTSPSSTPTPKPAAAILGSKPTSSTKLLAEIKRPTIGDYVDRKITASGTLSELGSDNLLWAFVQPSSEKRYYPSKVSYDPNTKQWLAELTIGSEKETPDASFIVCLFTANLDDSNNLVQWMETGINNLPKDIVILQSIRVRRK